MSGHGDFQKLLPSAHECPGMQEQTATYTRRGVNSITQNSCVSCIYNVGLLPDMDSTAKCETSGFALFGSERESTGSTMMIGASKPLNAHKLQLSGEPENVDTCGVSRRDASGRRRHFLHECSLGTSAAKPEAALGPFGHLASKI